MTRIEALKELAAKVEAGDFRNDGTMYKAFGDKWVLCFDAAIQGSLDAAKSLHEAVLPGCQFHIATEANGEGFVAEIFDCNQDRFIAHACTPNPARAWLLAIIRALIAEEETPPH